MLIFHNTQHHLHQGRHEIYRGRLVPCHETPARLDHVLAELQRRPVGELRIPGVPDLAQFERIHDPRYLAMIQGAWDEWIALDPANAEMDILPSIWPARGLRQDVKPINFTARIGQFAFDTGTPLTAGTWVAALYGAGCSIDAARSVADKTDTNAAMALTRPPGHHAGADFFGGYCFLNNAALAAQTLLDGGAQRVAVLDIDYHHGNGTQSIFYERADVLTVSIHGDPLTEYPFYLGYADEIGHAAGTGYNLNLPLPAGTGFAEWKNALQYGLASIRRFGTDALVVALGVDTFEGDPISRFLLKSEDYFTVGGIVASSGLPTVFVLEGGYAVEAMGVNVVNVLEGFNG